MAEINVSDLILKRHDNKDVVAFLARTNRNINKQLKEAIKEQNWGEVGMCSAMLDTNNDLLLAVSKKMGGSDDSLSVL